MAEMRPGPHSGQLLITFLHRPPIYETPEEKKIGMDIQEVVPFQWTLP